MNDELKTLQKEHELEKQIAKLIIGLERQEELITSMQIALTEIYENGEKNV